MITSSEYRDRTIFSWEDNGSYHYRLCGCGKAPYQFKTSEAAIAHAKLSIDATATQIEIEEVLETLLENEQIDFEQYTQISDLVSKLSNISSSLSSTA